MAVATTGKIDGSCNGAGMDAYITWEITDQEASNYTTVSVSLYVSKADGWARTYGDNGSWSITINGVTTSTAGYFSISAGQTKFVMSATIDVYHDPDGSAPGTLAGNAIAVKVAGGISGTTWTTTTVPGNIAFNDFSRPPAAPGLSWSRTNNGATLSATLSSTVNGASIFRGTGGNMYWQYSTNSGTSWSSSYSSGDSVSISNTADINIRAWATDSEGTSGYASAYGGPGIPRWDDTSLATNVLINVDYTTYGNYYGHAYPSIYYTELVGGSFPPGLSFTDLGWYYEYLYGYWWYYGYFLISGAPTTPGTYTFTVRAWNQTGYSDQNYTITVLGGALVRSGGSWIKGTTKVWHAGQWKPASINVRTNGAWEALG